MKILLLYLAFFCSFNLLGQTDAVEAIKGIESYQKKLNTKYKSPKDSPLDPQDRKKFTNHDFFPIDLKFRVQAQLRVFEDEEIISMKTTTDRKPLYRKYAEAFFVIEGIQHKLILYRSADIVQNPTSKQYLFLPFTDLTNGEETYGGGRYIDLTLPADEHEIIIDFNKAYNPYCAYSKRYSCPIVPSENHLELKVLAGVKFEGK